MKSSSEHLLKLVSDLLDFHRLDLNKAEVNRIVFNPAQLFEEIRVCFEPLTAAKGLVLQCHIAPELSEKYISDPLRIQQIVNNLLSNAVKFTQQGKITLTVGYNASKLTIAVADTGKGMASEDRERIFQEFTRLPGAQGEEGFGLGLSIVHKLVLLLEGTIDVQSTLGKGSCFTVVLPLFPVGKSIVENKPFGSRIKKPSKDTDVSPEETDAVPAMKVIRVLLIDDDKIQLNLTAAMLKQHNIDAVCCEQLEELIEQLRSSTFDVLLTDIQMPSADGFSVLAAVRGVNSALPVVAVSARGELEAGDFSDRGFAGCLRKPFTANELIAVLDAVCGAGKARSAEDAEGAEKSGAAGIVVGAGEPVSAGKHLGKRGADGAADNAPEVSEGGVNFGPLTAYAGDDAEAARGILESFAEQSAANCRLLERALESGDVAALKAVAHKMLPIFTMLGAAGVAATLRTAESWEGPLTDALRGEIGAAAENIRAIVAEAQKKVSLP